MATRKITRHLLSPAPEPASALPPPHADEIVVVVACALAALALFCGLFVRHVPESHLLQGVLVACGILALAAAAMWLDRRGSEREETERKTIASLAKPLGSGD